RIRVETRGGIIELRVRTDGQVSVDMGPPRLAPAQIPFQADSEQRSYRVDVDGQQVELAAISMGNPHAVLRVENVDSAPVHELGPRLEHHPRFPQRVNVGFLQVIDRHQARLRVWERGAGETRACGTGACAAAVAAIRQGWMDSPVPRDPPGDHDRPRRARVRRTDPPMTEQTQDTPLDADAVAQYLRQHPEFFVDFEELIPELRIPHQPGQAVSLVERQVKLLRERNIELRQRLNQLMDVARDNDRLFDKSKRLVLALLDAGDLEDLISAVEDSLRHDFQVPFVSLVL